MTTDPKDAEIARLQDELAVSEAACEGALMILVQTQAERDAALAQVAMTVFCADCENTATRTDDNRCGTCGSGRIMAGKAPSAAISRRDAQMRAEGRKDGLREAAGIADQHNDAGYSAYSDGWHHCSRSIASAILAAAEKEAQG